MRGGSGCCVSRAGSAVPLGQQLGKPQKSASPSWLRPIPAKLGAILLAVALLFTLSLVGGSRATT